MVGGCARGHDNSGETWKCPREQWVAAFLPFLGPDLAAKLAYDLVCRCEIGKPNDTQPLELVDPGPLSAYGLEKGEGAALKPLVWFGDVNNFEWGQSYTSSAVDGSDVVLTLYVTGGWG